jgi:hypothetical protein
MLARYCEQVCRYQQHEQYCYSVASIWQSSHNHYIEDILCALIIAVTTVLKPLWGRVSWWAWRAARSHPGMLYDPVTKRCRMVVITACREMGRRHCLSLLVTCVSPAMTSTEWSKPALYQVTVNWAHLANAQTCASAPCHIQHWTWITRIGLIVL